MSTEFDEIIKATAGLAKRAGATEFKMSFQDLAPHTKWFATATFEKSDFVGRSGTAEKSGEGGNPGYACESLAIKLLDGTVCGRCNHVIAVTGSDPTYCQWRRQGDVWLPGCGMPIDESIDVVPRV